MTGWRPGRIDWHRVLTAAALAVAVAAVGIKGHLIRTGKSPDGPSFGCDWGLADCLKFWTGSEDDDGGFTRDFYPEP